MNSKRLYLIMVAVVCLFVIGLGGGAYGANTILQDRSKAIIQARSKALALEQQQTQLAKAKASIEKYQEVAGIAKSIVPQDKDQAQAVREIVKIASEHGIILSSITFPASTLGSTTGGSTSGGTSGSTSGSSSGSSGSGSTSSSTPKNKASTISKSALSQLKPAPGISGVYILQIAVESGTDNPTNYDQFISFLAALEHNRRTALVKSITIQPDIKNPSLVSFTLTIDEYVKQ